MPGLSHPGAVFLDRDGTINRKAPDGEYITRPEEVEVLPGAAAAIRRLNEAGLTVIVATNQRGIALGRMSEADLEAVHAELEQQLEDAARARLDAIFHCPHDVGTCDCRKPATGMFRQAQERYPWLDPRRSAMVGDGEDDVAAGRSLGMSSLRLGADVPDLAAAVDQLLRGDSARS